MNEQEKQLLKFIENGYSLKKIREMTDFKEGDLLPYFMTILKKQIEIYIKKETNSKTLKTVILHIENILKENEVNIAISSKKFRNYKTKILFLAQNLNNKEYLEKIKSIMITIGLKCNNINFIKKNII